MRDTFASMKVETAEEYRQRVARAGGHGRAAALTPKERQKSARKAAQARWAKKKAPPPAK